MRAIAKDLDRVQARGQPDGPEIQLVFQVCSSASYRQFRNAWEHAWRKKRTPWSTAMWPAQLPEGEVGVLSLPLAAGRVGPAIGKHPRPVVDPLFTTGGGEGLGYRDAVLTALAGWLAQPGLAAQLAPPVVEVLQRGAVTSRRLLELDMPWTLPPPDGL